MMLYPIEQLQRMRPNWAQLDQAALMMVAQDDAGSTERFDATSYLMVLEGKVSLESGSERVIAEEGEMTILRAGEACRIAPSGTNAVLLRLIERPLPPFRSGAFGKDAEGPILLPPTGPIPSPKRRGVKMTFALDATFQPTQLLENAGMDVLLEASPGALSPAQVREFRTITRRNHQAMVGLLVDVIDGEIEKWFGDATQVSNMELMHPQALAVRADLATKEGRAVGDLVLKHWSAPLRTDGIRPGIMMPMRNWNEEEIRGIFSWLAKVPPAALAVLVEWDPQRFNADFLARATVEALVPWLHAVEFIGENGAGEVAHYLDGLGSQAWVVSRR